MDADGFVRFMAKDVFFRNESAEPFRGRDAARNDISALYFRINGINHVLNETWVQGNASVPCTHLGPYEVLSAIGVGGMGCPGGVSGDWDATIPTNRPQTENKPWELLNARLEKRTSVAPTGAYADVRKRWAAAGAFHK